MTALRASAAGCSLRFGGIDVRARPPKAPEVGSDQRLPASAPVAQRIERRFPNSMAALCVTWPVEQKSKGHFR